jgi:plastocyanin
MIDDKYNFKNRNSQNNNRIERTKDLKLVAIGLITTLFVLFIIVSVYPGFMNHRTEAANAPSPSFPGNTTHHLGPNSTSTNTLPLNTTAGPKMKIKESTNTTTNATANATKNKSNNNTVAKTTNTNSSTSQPNSNVSKLTTTQGNITTNANAPGSPFPPKEANSTSYFPPTNKVAIVVGAALLRDKAYQPNPVNIKTGGVVTWNNDDTVVHTVTSGVGLQDPHLGNQFDSGLLGGHFSHIFFKAGVFPYFCQIHPTMVGKVIVK